MSFVSNYDLDCDKRKEITDLSTFSTCKPISMNGWSAEKKSKVFDQLLAEYYLDMRETRFYKVNKKFHRRYLDALNIIAYRRLTSYVQEYYVDTYASKRWRREPKDYKIKVHSYMDKKERTGFLRCLPIVISAWIRNYWTWDQVVNTLKASRKDFFGLLNKGCYASHEKVKVTFRKKLKRFLLKQIDKL